MAGTVSAAVAAARREPAPVNRWLMRLLVRKLEHPEGRAVVPRGAPIEA
jgi:hypothetical protein